MFPGAGRKWGEREGVGWERDDFPQQVAPVSEGWSGGQYVKS